METVNDIIEEMRNWDFHSHLDGAGHAELSIYADRIEAAYDRELVDKYSGVVNEREKEVERLRAALKPVLARDITRHPCDGFCKILEDVREARRIGSKAAGEDD